MADTGESTEQEQTGVEDERSAGRPAGADDQAHRTAPPGNPEADREAVEKGEENIGRVSGR